ncbi:MAG TPA: methyltransferase domain-containing protein [Deltaproteobacteria bacterium]|nr:methyltransferase domain-containing protein [Deltaproteobacteria bacterium]
MMAHKFSPQSIERLLSEERCNAVKPHQFLRDCGLDAGMTVADVGCGPGFFTVPASNIVGRKGLVYAIDVQEEMIRILKRRTRRKNIVPLLSKEHRIPLDARTVDFALLAYVLHEAEDKFKFLKEVKRIMKKGARIVVLDWKKKREKEGPPFAERLALKDARRLVEEAGLSVDRVSSFGSSHYIISALK